MFVKQMFFYSGRVGHCITKDFSQTVTSDVMTDVNLVDHICVLITP